MIDLISILHSKTKNYFKEQLAVSDVNYRQGRIMNIIGHKPGITSTQICEETKLDKGTVAKIINKIESEGFIRKEVNSNDSRVYYLFPEDLLVENLPKYDEIKDNWEAILTKGLSDIEIHILRELLSKAEKNALDYYKA